MGGSGGSTIVYDSGGTARMTISDSAISLSSAGTVAVTATSTMTLTASTVITFDLTSSSPTGIDFNSQFLTGYEYSSSTVSGSAVTVNAMTGLITSATSTLAAGSTETLTLTNSRITSTAVVLMNVQTRCSSGYIYVVGVTPSSGTASIVVANLASSACTSTYTLGFFVAVG